jgi:GntR family transcriptional regulator
LADSEPLAVETSCISFMGCERLLEKDLERDSLYGLLEIVYDMPPMEAEQELEADLARDEEAGLLEVEVGSPILRTRRVTATRRNQPIEYATSIYRGDKYRFYTRMVRDQR